MNLINLRRVSLFITILAVCMVGFGCNPNIKNLPVKLHDTTTLGNALEGGRPSLKFDGAVVSIGGEDVEVKIKGDWDNGQATFCLTDKKGEPCGLTKSVGVSNCLLFKYVSGDPEQLKVDYGPKNWNLNFGGIPITNPNLGLRFEADSSKEKWLVKDVSLLGNVADDYNVTMNLKKDKNGKWTWEGSTKKDNLMKLGDLSEDYFSVSVGSITVAKVIGSDTGSVTLAGTFEIGLDPENLFHGPASLSVVYDSEVFLLTGTVTPSANVSFRIPGSDIYLNGSANAVEIEVQRKASKIKDLFSSVKGMKVTIPTNLTLPSSLSSFPVGETAFVLQDGIVTVDQKLNKSFTWPENNENALAGTLNDISLQYDMKKKSTSLFAVLSVTLPEILKSSNDSGLSATLTYDVTGKSLSIAIEPPSGGLTLLGGALVVTKFGMKQIAGASLFNVSGKLTLKGKSANSNVSLDVDNFIVMVSPFPMIFVDELNGDANLLGFDGKITKLKFPFPAAAFEGSNRPVKGGDGVPVDVSVNDLSLTSTNEVWKSVIPGGTLSTRNFKSPKLMLPHLGNDPFSVEHLPGTIFSVLFAVVGEYNGEVALSVPGVATTANYSIDSKGLEVNFKLGLTKNPGAAFGIHGQLGPNSYTISGNGEVTFLGVEGKETITFGDKGFSFVISGNVFGGSIWADLVASGDDITKPSTFKVKGTMQSGFGDAVLKGVTGKFQDAIDSAKGEVEQLEKKLSGICLPKPLKICGQDIIEHFRHIKVPKWAQKWIDKIKDVTGPLSKAKDKLTKARNHKKNTLVTVKSASFTGMLKDIENGQVEMSVVLKIKGKEGTTTLKSQPFDFENSKDSITRLAKAVFKKL